MYENSKTDRYLPHPARASAYEAEQREAEAKRAAIAKRDEKSATCASPGEPYGPPTLPQMLGALRASIETTHELCGELEGRLSGVRRLIPTPGESGSATGPSMTSAPLCDVVEDALSAQYAAHARMRNLLDSLAL